MLLPAHGLPFLGAQVPLECLQKPAVSPSTRGDPMLPRQSQVVPGPSSPSETDVRVLSRWQVLSRGKPSCYPHEHLEEGKQQRAEQEEKAFPSHGSQQAAPALRSHVQVRLLRGTQPRPAGVRREGWRRGSISVTSCDWANYSNGPDQKPDHKSLRFKSI